jgi:hypothetical protein
MTRVTHLRPEFVISFPTPMERGVIYVSIEYNNCGHLCACGCGREVFTPLSPAQWTLTYDGENITMHPSIGNWSQPCRSHYFVHRGHVRWARDYTEHEIAQNRHRDRALLGDHTSGRHLLGPAEEGVPATKHLKPGMRHGRKWKQMIKLLRRLVR